MKAKLISCLVVLVATVSSGEDAPPLAARKLAEALKKKWDYAHVKPKSISVIKQIEAGDFDLKTLAPEIDLMSPNVGEYGRLAKTVSLRVFQIVDGETMIVIPESRRSSGETIVLKGFPTKGIADGKMLGIQDVIMVTGTEQDIIKTTRYVVEPLDVAFWKAKILEMAGVWKKKP